MQLHRKLSHPAAYRGGFVAIGNFDGVHLGHRRMIEVLVRNARAANVPAVAFTFEPHPIAILRPGHVPPALCTLDRKAELLAELGVNCLIAYRTGRELLGLTPDGFFEKIVRGELAAAGLVEGANFCFGRDRSGDVTCLKRLCDSAGLRLDVVPQVTVGEVVVSSSVVRSLIQTGRVRDAADLLGTMYRVRGTVSAGSARGRTIGFPTANLTGVETVLPPDGVYAGRAFVGGKPYAAAINLGPNPTFDETARKLEAHLLDFAGDLYGKSLDVAFLQHLRNTVPFANVDELRSQLVRDVAQVRDVVAAVEAS
jgi:riboflavin kinase/FMN adenylyltransferase